MDASKFSLEAAASLIKPYVPYLSFKRLVDYTDDTLRKENVDGVQYRLALWATNTALKSNMDVSCKAYGFDAALNKVQHATSNMLVFYEHRLLMLCPTNDISWAYQSTKFVPTKDLKGYYVGESEVCWVDDSNLKIVAGFLPNLAERFWGGMIEWVVKSLNERKKIMENMEELATLCARQINSLGNFPIKIEG